MPPELADRPPTPLEVSLDRLDTLVSPYVGVVRGVEEVLAEPWDIPLRSLCCETGYLGSLVGAGASQIGAGSGTTARAARAAAIGEAVERYSACDSASAPIELGTAEELGARAVPPHRFALYSAAQHARPGFPYTPFGPRTTVAWVEAFALPDLEPALVPAQLVYLAWEPREGEQRIGHATSSGLACHATPEEALLSGLLELLERDAFMITWKARLSLPRLCWEADGRLGAFEGFCLRPTGLSIAAVDLSEFWNVPCVLGVVRSRAPGEAPLGVGAAAAETVERAVEKALDEAVRVRTWARTLRLADPERLSLPAVEKIVQFDEHIHHYAYEEHVAAVDFLDASPERRDSTLVSPLEGVTVLERLAGLCRRLADRGLTAYAVDVTSCDVRAAGLHVVKVVVPELAGLDVEHAAQLLGGTRLYDEPLRLGRRDHRLEEHELSPDPHPFP